MEMFVVIILIALMLVAVFFAWKAVSHTRMTPQLPIKRIPFVSSSYYEYGDCPYMTENVFGCELFLKWVYDNRNRIEIAYIRPFIDDENYYTFFVTTPYVLGGWMFLEIDKNGVELYVAKDLWELKHSFRKAAYSPNWNYVSTDSKRLWTKLRLWHNEQVELAKQMGYGINWINPKLKEQK